jgi:hypothetical protein
MGEGRGWIGRIHRRTDVALGYGLRPREAAVVRGMVLGDRSLMPEDLETAFQRSGVAYAYATCLLTEPLSQEISISFLEGWLANFAATAF